MVNDLRPVFCLHQSGRCLQSVNLGRAAAAPGGMYCNGPLASNCFTSLLGKSSSAENKYTHLVPLKMALCTEAACPQPGVQPRLVPHCSFMPRPRSEK